MVLREPNDPLNQSRGIMGPLENATGVQNNRGRLRQRFDLIRKLGQGTYGKVQLGIDKETGQEVAIKTIKKSKIETEADLIRIRREIQIMSSVRHPNIIHIYEVFENREKMVLVMEYAAGGELYDYLNERKVLQDDEARRIFQQIASAVYYCHKHKICHRDLKLENILLDEKFNAKIADFGLSNVFDEVNLLKTFCGSPLYASPEIVRGTPYKGPEVDCWSLGVLLYTLVYGAMPFDGSNFKRLVKQISHGDYFEPKKPAEASPLIRIMLTVDPKKRADIRKVCSHPWVNQGSEKDCLAVADELATQTPVRLDLLLALANCSAISHNQVVIDQQPPQQQNAPPPPTQPVDASVNRANEANEAKNDAVASNESGDQHAPKKPKRSKMQSKSKSSPMLELIHDVEEDLELPAAGEKGQDGVDQCDTLSEISEIQTLAEDIATEGVTTGKSAENASKNREKSVLKKDAPKVKEAPKKSPVPSPALVEPPSAPSPAQPVVVDRKPKKTEPQAEPPKQSSVTVELKSVKKETPVPSVPPVEEDKKKKVVKPSISPETEKVKPDAKKEATEAAQPTQPQKPQPSVAPTQVAKPKEEPVNKETAPPSREVTPAPPAKEKSASPGDKDSGESGEEGKSRARLKDRADSVSPTRIERRNSKIISQKTAELIQNLETKVSPSGTQSSLEPAPKPPGIKKIVIPNFKVSDAKSKFESKPPRPLTTSVSRSKAAFEAKLQSQSSVEEKSPPKASPPKTEAAPPAEPTKAKPTAEVVATETAPQKLPKEEPIKNEKIPTKVADAQPQTQKKAEVVKPAEPSQQQQTEPVVAAPAPVPTPPKQVTKVPPGKVQPATTTTPASSAEKPVAAVAATNIPTTTSTTTPVTSEVKPVLMDSGSGAPRKAVMVVKGKASNLNLNDNNRIVKSQASCSPLLEPTAQPQTSISVHASSDDHPNDSNSTNLACIDSGTCDAPVESCTEGETGKSGGTPPTPLGPAAAAKQKLLSKLPPAPTPSATAAAPLQNAQNGSNKELAVKNITSAISKVVNSGSVSKGLNLEDGPKKFSTLPKAQKHEPEKIVKTEVSFPVSAPEIPITPQQVPTKEPSQNAVSKQQKQEHIIPIKFVEDVTATANTTPPATTAPSASPSVTSVTSRASTTTTTPGTPLLSHRDSTGSLFSRQNSSDAESSVATVPHKLEPIRKCPREFLIPIKLEDSGQTVTPKEELTSGGSTADVSQAGGEDDFRIDSRLRSGRFARPKRYSSLLSDSSFDEEPSVSAAANKPGARRASAASTPGTTTTTATHTRSRSQGDEPTTPGGTFKRYRNRRHNTAAPDMPLDRSDSFSSAEEDEEDAFQVLTAESLFSNLLDRVRNLTRRINRDDPMMTPNWSTDPATFGLWGASPLREFMSSRAPSETRSFTSSGPGSYRRESSVSMNSTTGGPGGAWRRSLSRDLSGESDSGHSASINTTNAQSRSQLSRLSSDLFETSSSRSLPLSSRRSPSYLSHRSVDNDLGTSYSGISARPFSRTLSHSAGDYNGTSATGQISRTLPLRRSLKTFDRGPQHVVPEYETTPSSMVRHSLLDSKYETPSSYLTRLRSQSQTRDRHGDREGSIARMRTLQYPSSSGEANGWDGGQDAVSTSSSIAASLYGSGGGTSSISPMSTTVSLDSESMFSPNSSAFSFPTLDNSPSRLLSVQEKMNNYSQYYQSLTQRPFRRLPLASPSQIHGNSGGFGVGLSEIRNMQSSSISPSPGSAFSPPASVVPLTSMTAPLKIDPNPEVGLASSSTSDEGSATPCVQSPVSNPVSSITSPSISPPQVPSPILVTPKTMEQIHKNNINNNNNGISNEEEKINVAKPPTATTASSIPRWPAVSVRQHRPFSISSFPEGPRASSVSRVTSPPPVKPETVTKDVNGNGMVETATHAAVLNIQKRRDSRATSVERITRLLERKSMPREVPSSSGVGTGNDSVKKKAPTTEESLPPVTTNGEAKATEAEKGTSNQTTKKPKFLQNLEKKWEKLTHSGSCSNSKEHEVEAVVAPAVKGNSENSSSLLPNGTSTPGSPEPFQAGGTSEESSSHEDKINESVLLRRALSPEKKVKTTSRLGTSSGGTVGFMLGKFKKFEETSQSSSSTTTGSRIPTGRPPVSSTATSSAPRFGSIGRRIQLPYGGTTSDSVLTLAKESGRSADSSSVEEAGLIKNAAVVAQEKRHALHGNPIVKKEVPTTQEGPLKAVENVIIPTPTTVVCTPPQIEIHEDIGLCKVSSEALPQLDMSSLSPISVSDDTRTESDEGSGAPTKSNSGSALTVASDEPESVSDRILRKSFYNRFNASAGIDRNRRSHSVTPGSSRRAALGSPNNLRVNTTNSKNNGSGRQSPMLRLSNSPSSSTVASAESKDSTTGSEQSSSQNRATSPYLSGLNKYNPNPLFKELMLNEDYRAHEVCKKTEYSRKITSKLSKLLREIESDLNSCQLTKTESDEGDSSGLLFCAGRFPQEGDSRQANPSTNNVHPRPASVNRSHRAGSAVPIPNQNGNIVNEAA